MTRVRVLHCLETIGSGGVEQRRLSLARGLDPKRYEQQIVCTQASGGLPGQFEQVGCPIYEVGVFRGILDRRPYKNTLDVVRRFKPHIIHGAVYEGVAQAAVAGRLGRVPVIIGEETSNPENRRWKGRLLYRGLAGLCHHMVGVSPAVVGYLEKTLRLPSSKVTLINNGVAEKPSVTSNELVALRKRLKLPMGSFLIGTVGRLVDDGKRVSDLIRAMPSVVAMRADARLLIVGSGPDESSLRNLADELDVADRVIFAGYQEDTQPFYQLMDVFALASAHEAFGLVLVEAMFAELPVVATCVGGIPSVVKDGETGYLVKPYQPESLAKTILSLANDVSMRRSMGRNGRKRALERFSAERYVYDVDQFYQRLLAERKLK